MINRLRIFVENLNVWLRKNFYKEQNIGSIVIKLLPESGVRMSVNDGITDVVVLEALVSSLKIASTHFAEVHVNCRASGDCNLYDFANEVGGLVFNVEKKYGISQSNVNIKDPRNGRFRNK